MEGDMLKGHLDLIVLAALAPGPAHGYAVIEEIRRKSGEAFDLPEGTIYPALHRLEAAGAQAPHLCLDPPGHTRARRAPRGLGAVLRCDRQHAERRPSGQAGMIADYLDALSRALSFDPGLARGVRQEVEDHLCEAVAAAPVHDRREAERRAIANFGNPQALAAQFAVVALQRRARIAAFAVVLAIAGVLVAMKARVAWFEFVQWTLNDEVRAISATVLTVDRGAFWLAVGLGLAAVAYGWHIRGRAVRSRGGHRQACRACVLGAAATASLFVSVIGDGVLTALRVGTDLCASSLIPIGSLGVEIACATIAGLLILDTTRRAASSAALLRS